MFELAIVLCSTVWPVHCAVVATKKPIMDCGVKIEEVRKQTEEDPMGVVTWMVETTDNFLEDAAQTTFGNVAGQLGGVIAVASTLAVPSLVSSLMVLSVPRRTGTRSSAFT